MVRINTGCHTLKSKMEASSNEAICLIESMYKGEHMFRKIMTWMVSALTVSLSAQTTIPTNTGIIARDNTGKTYAIDSLLSSGKHIWLHLMRTG